MQKTETGKATFVRELNWRGDAHLYKLDPKHDGVEYVVVSAVEAYETYIFPADESGNVEEYIEMDGSFRGGLDHAEALRGLGYQVPA